MVQGFEQAQREYELKLALGPDYFDREETEYTYEDYMDSVVDAQIEEWLIEKHSKA